MLQKQISVFIENKRGRLAEITRILGENGVDMRALCIADTADFGILRIIADKTDLAVKVLKAKGFAVSITDVVALAVEDKPGGLAAALAVFDECDINIEYMYHFIRNKSEMATIIARVDNPEEAIIKLGNTTLQLLSSSDLNSL